MAYDRDLAERVRELLADEHPVREQAMFGGLSFLVAGNLAVAVHRHGGVLVRVDPDEAEALVASSAAEVAVMGARRMTGWLHVDADHVRTKRDLSRWVRRGVAYARSLPAK